MPRQTSAPANQSYYPSNNVPTITPTTHVPSPQRLRHPPPPSPPPSTLDPSPRPPHPIPPFLPARQSPRNIPTLPYPTSNPAPLLRMLGRPHPPPRNRMLDFLHLRNIPQCLHPPTARGDPNSRSRHRPRAAPRAPPRYR